MVLFTVLTYLCYLSGVLLEVGPKQGREGYPALLHHPVAHPTPLCSSSALARRLLTSIGTNYYTWDA